MQNTKFYFPSPLFLLTKYYIPTGDTSYSSNMIPISLQSNNYITATYVIHLFPVLTIPFHML